jgi:phage baseplate assembly protein W
LTDERDSYRQRPERDPPLLTRTNDDRAFIDMDNLADLLTSRVLSTARAEKPQILAVGHRLTTRAAAEVEPAIHRQLRSLEALATRTWRARVRLLEVQPDSRTKSIGAVILSAPAGRSVCVGSCLERAYVADWDVEVAQESRIGDPNIGHAFGGMVLNLELRPTGSGSAVAMSFDLIYSKLDPKFQTRRTGNQVTGIIEIPKTRKVRLERELVLVPGETRVVDGGTGADGRRLRIEITVE